MVAHFRVFWPPGMLYTLSCDRCKLHLAEDGRMVEKQFALQGTPPQLYELADKHGWDLEHAYCPNCHYVAPTPPPLEQLSGFNTLEAVNRSLKRPHIKESEAEFPVEVFELGDTDE